MSTSGPWNNDWHTPKAMSRYKKNPWRSPPPVTRSLRRYELRVDTAFDEVVRACADPRRPHGWISPAIESAYGRLHELGWAHSVEAWEDDRLTGGLYGVSIAGLFAGESMFHRSVDASKVALVGLVGFLRSAGATLLDVQWSTPHLARLGVIEVPRERYLVLLADALERPLTTPWPTGSLLLDAE